MAHVDQALVEFVAAYAGPHLLDLGCGLGGYSRALGGRGFVCRALDVNADYVRRAQALGVDAACYDGGRLPVADRAVDTVILLEVLEHLDDPSVLLREARRVATRNVLVSVPDCGTHLDPAPVELTHMLDADHRQFFTAESLTALLASVFGKDRTVVKRDLPVDELLAGVVLPRGMRRLYHLLVRAGIVKPRLYFRLLGRAAVESRPVPETPS
jgi:SAM-dependent methyltransferase